MRLYNIFISDSAQKDLEKIYEYCINISYNYAEKTKNQLLSSLISLKVFPRGFPKIKLKYHKNLEYRYFISNNFKILYLIKDNFVIVQKIINCKQNPKNKL